MRFSFIKKAIAVAAILAIASVASAEWKPNGPLKVQVGFGAGGSTDTLARVIGKALESQTGWNVIVENKPGGGGVAMFSVLANQKADGQTVAIGVNLPILMQLALRGDKIPFKITDFDYLATIATAPLAIVAKADAPFNDFKEFIEYAKKKGSGTVGFGAGPQKFLMMSAAKQADVKLRLVNNKGGAETLQAILGGHIDIGFAAGAHIKYLEAGTIKMIAVATSKRHTYAPDAKSLVEQGFQHTVEPIFYIATSKGLAPEAKAALAKALDDALHSDDVIKIVNNVLNTTPVNLGPEGTTAKLVGGADEIQGLIDAATKK